MNKTSYTFIVLGIAVLVGLFFLLRKPASAPSQNVNSQNNNINLSDNKEPQVPPTIEAVLQYTKGATLEVTTVRVQEGQQVVLKITSDVADEVHLHGYDLSQKLEPNKEGTLQFTGDKTGRFDLELHEAGKVLAVLEVYPK